MNGLAVIIASHDDFHALAVVEQILQLGGEAVMLDSAELLTGWQITARIGSPGARYEIALGDRVIPCDQISGLWWRRPNEVVASPDITDKEVAYFCVREATALLHGMLLHLGDRVINPFNAHRAGRNKPLQLEAARRHGFSIPETLIASSGGAVTAFAAEAEGELIFKVLTTAPGMRLVETRVLEPDFLTEMDSLRYAPAIFQARVEKTVDLRVTLIDGQCFTVACRTAGGELDWRIAEEIEYTPYDLPADVAQRLAALHRDLGLRYGAIDLCLTPEGDCVFLETNVGGQFMFCEIDGGLPLARAMAQALLRPPGGVDFQQVRSGPAATAQA